MKRTRCAIGDFEDTKSNVRRNTLSIKEQGTVMSPPLSPQIRSDQSLSRVRLFATPWIAARQASLSTTNSWSSLRLTSIKSVMPSSYLILCPQSLPASESFPMSQLFSWGGQSTGVSALASFLPNKSQGWSPLLFFFPVLQLYFI